MVWQIVIWSQRDVAFVLLREEIRMKKKRCLFIVLCLLGTAQLSYGDPVLKNSDELSDDEFAAAEAKFKKAIQERPVDETAAQEAIDKLRKSKKLHKDMVGGAEKKLKESIDRSNELSDDEFAAAEAKFKKAIQERPVDETAAQEAIDKLRKSKPHEHVGNAAEKGLMQIIDRSNASKIAQGQIDKIKCDDPNFSTWNSRCETLEKPSIPWSDSKERSILNNPNIILHPDCFLSELRKFIKTSKELFGSNQFVIEPNTTAFNPFVGKLELPNNSIIAFHGDLHGDVFSLNKFIVRLQNDGYIEDGSFQIKNPNFYMVFLGDYTDRGLYGMEVMYTIMRLKLANPDRVFLVRGNHEDLDLIHRYGFEDELRRKIPYPEKVKECLKQLGYFYNTLPVALYIGTKNKSSSKDFILCCHGGIEIGFDENALLESNRAIEYRFIGDLKRRTYLPSYSESVQAEILRSNDGQGWLKDIHLGSYMTVNLGFMWNDFEVDAKIPLWYNPKRGLIISKSLLLNHLANRSVSKSHSLKGVFRAHQHDFVQTPMMNRILNNDKQSPDGEKGVGKIWNRKAHDSKPTALWDGIVATFLVSPFTPYTGSFDTFNYDAFGLLKLAPEFENWQLEVIRNEKNVLEH